MTHSKSQKRIAILGANGRLSREVARAFHSAGWLVRAVTRTGQSKPLRNLTGIEFANANALIEAELIRATEGCDVIFNGLNPPYTDWEKACPPLTANVIAAAVQHGATHLFAGNIYNFGSQMPETLVPGVPFRPDRKKARIRTEMENAFAEAALKNDMQTIVLRAGDFFGGDGTGSWFDELLIKYLDRGKITYPGNDIIPHAWAYLPDLAKAFVAIADSAEELSVFETFHFEGHNVSCKEIKSAIEAATGTSLKTSRLPTFLFKFMGLFSAKMREVSEVSYLWRVPHQMKDNTFERRIGHLARTPLREAVRQAIINQGMAHLVQRPGNVLVQPA